VWWCDPANDECVQGSHLDDGLQIGAGAESIAGEGPCDLKALGLRAGIVSFAAGGFGLQDCEQIGPPKLQRRFLSGGHSHLG